MLYNTTMPTKTESIHTNMDTLSPNTTFGQRVLMALSGGVDSAIAVKILQQQGYQVEGIVICFSPAHIKAVEAAKIAALELSIPLDVIHCEDVFDQEIVLPFCETYSTGRTPNPCVNCNPKVKFAILAEEATRRGIQYIASGHYASIQKKEGISYIAKAASIARDQSYMLYRLPEQIRSRLLLPVGEFEKPHIRKMAAEYGLTSASSPDSQEICFIPHGDYANYINQRGIQGKTGHIFSPDGKDLGSHKGVIHYTVGQRRGLGISLGKPVFVKHILEDGSIQLGWGGEEFSSAIEIADISVASIMPLQDGEKYTVKIRSAAHPVPCQIQIKQNATFIVFDTPQRAAAPGQHAVLYNGPLVIGGGVIKKAIDSLT